MHEVFCFRLPTNTFGRDFVVGPVRGRFVELGARLRRLHYRPGPDRLIFTGDVVTAGADVPMACAWLARPGVYAIRGRAEALFETAITALRERRSLDEARLHLATSGRWILKASAATVRTWHEAISHLPYVIEVAQPAGDPIGVVHAEVPLGLSWSECLQRAHEPSVQRSLLFGRRRAYATARHGVATPSHVESVVGVRCCFSALPTHQLTAHLQGTHVALDLHDAVVVAVAIAPDSPEPNFHARAISPTLGTLSPPSARSTHHDPSYLSPRPEEHPS